MTTERQIHEHEDPVCGMVVDAADSKAKGLVASHAGREFVFCGKGCYLEFRDDPERHLAAGYQPSM